MADPSLPTTADFSACLLYTSDAADERSSVDLGGRRIIKKKKTEKIEGTHHERTNKEKKITIIKRVTAQ